MKEKIHQKGGKILEKKSQLPIAFILIIFICIFTFFIHDSKLINYLLFGIGFGIILQKSRFCFTAAFRDPILTKTSTLSNALLLSVAIGSAGVAILNFIYLSQGKKLIGIDAVYPLSFLTIIGGVLFGIGMVIAGGCASGTLVRMGEGLKLNFISFFFFLIGAILGAGLMGYLDPLFQKGKITIFLPDRIGWIPSIIFQFGMIFIAYISIKKLKNRK